MEQRKHAVEVLEKVLEQRQGFFLGGQWLEDTTNKDVSKHFGLPVLPLGILFIHGVLNGFLKRCVSGLFIYPLDTFG